MIYEDLFFFLLATKKCSINRKSRHIYHEPLFWKKKLLRDNLITKEEEIILVDGLIRKEYGILYVSRNGKIIKNNILLKAAKWGYVNILFLMISKGATRYDRAMDWAEKEGHIEIIKTVLCLNGKFINHGKITRLASQEGHIEVVRKMLDLGAKSYISAAELSSRKGRKEIVEMMINPEVEKYHSMKMSIMAHDGRTTNDDVVSEKNSCIAVP